MPERAVGALRDGVQVCAAFHIALQCRQLRVQALARIACQWKEKRSLLGQISANDSARTAVRRFFEDDVRVNACLV